MNLNNHNIISTITEEGDESSTTQYNNRNMHQNSSISQITADGREYDRHHSRGEDKKNQHSHSSSWKYKRYASLSSQREQSEIEYSRKTKGNNNNNDYTSTTEEHPSMISHYSGSNRNHLQKNS